MGCRWGISTPASFGQSSELPELVLTSLLSVDDKGIYSGTVVVDFYFYSILFLGEGPNDHRGEDKLSILTEK